MSKSAKKLIVIKFDAWDELSIKQAEIRKARCENMGYALVHHTATSFTYRKPTEQQQPLNLD